MTPTGVKWLCPCGSGLRRVQVRKPNGRTVWVCDKCREEKLKEKSKAEMIKE